MIDTSDRAKYETLRGLREAEAGLAFGLDVFGDRLAKKMGYKEHTGLEAIHFYLVERYRWTPANVKSLSWDDLRFLMAEEMHGFVLPEAALAKRTDR